MSKHLQYPLSGLAFKLRFNISRDLCVEQRDKTKDLWSIGIWNQKKHSYEYSEDLSYERIGEFVVNAAIEALSMARDESKLVPKGNK